MKLADLLQDLLDEQESLDEVVAGLDDGGWDLPTPSPRWSVTDQIGHLRYFDNAAALAIRDPDAFSTEAERLMAASLESETSGDDFTLGDFRRLASADRLDSWRQGRAALAAAAGTLGERDRVSWYGPSMGAKSFLTARLMEAWAHGTDVCDTVGARREPTHRLRHVAQLGYITRAWSYVNRGEPAPAGDVRVELSAPSEAPRAGEQIRSVRAGPWPERPVSEANRSGKHPAPMRRDRAYPRPSSTNPSPEIWTWGDAGAAGDNAVRGPALDFCLVVTQRRHVADTGLEVTGELAIDWLSKAQAFAGPPTDGPATNRSRSEP